MSNISFAVLFNNDTIQPALPAATQKLNYFGCNLKAVVVLRDEKGLRLDLAECLSQKTYENIFEIVQATLTEHAEALFLSPQQGYVPRQLTENFLSFDRLRVPNKLSMELSSLASEKTAQELLRSCAHRVRSEVHASHNQKKAPITRVPADVLSKIFSFLPKEENVDQLFPLCKPFKATREQVFQQKLMEIFGIKDAKALDEYLKLRFPQKISYQGAYKHLVKEVNEAKDFLVLMLCVFMKKPHAAHIPKNKLFIENLLGSEQQQHSTLEKVNQFVQKLQGWDA
ncbi:MAG: hypothetical protein ACM3JI_03825, partial [Anaerolineae bacterium]